MNCPHCGHDEYVKHSRRYSVKDGGYRQRWRCKQCRKTWTPDHIERGPNPEGEAALTPAERQRKRRQRRKQVKGTDRVNGEFQGGNDELRDS